METVTLDCAVCDGRHMLQARRGKSIVIACRLCSTITSYHSKVWRTSTLRVSERSKPLRGVLTSIYATIVGVVEESSSHVSNKLLTNTEEIDLDRLFIGIPHEEEHALWRRRVT